MSPSLKSIVFNLLAALTVVSAMPIPTQLSHTSTVIADSNGHFAKRQAKVVFVTEFATQYVTHTAETLYVTPTPGPERVAHKANLIKTEFTTVDQYRTVGDNDDDAPAQSSSVEATTSGSPVVVESSSAAPETTSSSSEEPTSSAAPETTSSSEEPASSAAPETTSSSSEEPASSAAPETTSSSEVPSSSAAPETTSSSEEPTTSYAPETTSSSEEPTTSYAPETTSSSEVPSSSAAPETTPSSTEEPTSSAAPETTSSTEEPTPSSTEAPTSSAAPETTSSSEVPTTSATPEPATSSEAPAPSVAPSSAADPEPERNAHKAEDQSSGDFQGEVFKGEGTFYTPGLGACGRTHTDNDLIVAINHLQYGNSVNPNFAEVCGRCALIKGPKGQVKVEVVDRCPGCAHGDMDMSPAAFNHIAEFDQGRIPISWSFVQC